MLVAHLCDRRWYSSRWRQFQGNLFMAIERIKRCFMYKKITQKDLSNRIKFSAIFLKFSALQERKNETFHFYFIDNRFVSLHQIKKTWICSGHFMRTWKSNMFYRIINSSLLSWKCFRKIYERKSSLSTEDGSASKSITKL